MELDLGVVVLSFVIGLLIAALVWSLTRKPAQSQKGKSEKNVSNKTKETKKSQAVVPSKPAKNKKNVSAPAKADSKASFTHSWLLTSLKGHTGPITDMAFSPNGKHLATCAEDDDVFVMRPTVDTPTPSETDSGCVLSRRQKKNRSKKASGSSKKKDQPQQQLQQQQQQTKAVETKKRMRRATPLKYYVRLQMKNSELYTFLSRYVLQDDQLLNLGYPVESAFYPDRAIIYKSPDANVTYYRTEFRNKQETIELAEHLFSSSETAEEKPPLSPSLEKRCVRCKKGFFVTLDGEYLTEEKCTYHWGQWKRSPGEFHGYTCCQGREDSAGCATGELHVWNGVSAGMNGPFTDYARTKPGGTSCQSIYALDCEMCYTGRGLEVCKVSVISIDGCLVYETLVKPQRKVVDYNTRFSGLSEKDLKKATKTVRDVQHDLFAFINSKTILIGHGLENDLRALQILHSKVIDTAVLFPHYFGFPFRRSLKSLVAAYLQRNIQTSQNGHDSFEDARACAELVLWKAACQLRRNKSEH